MVMMVVPTPLRHLLASLLHGGLLAACGSAWVGISLVLLQLLVVSQYAT